MEITTGTDIIEIERVKNSIEETKEKFIERVYTKKEEEYCESKKMQKYQHYAARFAGKEAVFKAISKHLENKYSIGWKNIEIKNDSNGRPYVELCDIENNDISEKELEQLKKIKQIDISLSHCKEYAIANVIVIW